MTNKIYVTRRIVDPALPMLSKECEVTLNKKMNPPCREEILKNVAGKDGILCMLSDRIDAPVMDAAGPNLKVISSYSTGFEHIDIRGATSRGIYVTYTAHILTEATADLTFALILACARNIVKADSYVRNKMWRVGWSPDLMLGSEVYGASLGIIGLGRIGAAVARRARGFNMKIFYYNRNRDSKIESELGIKYRNLEDLLEQSDFVSIHASLNTQSRQMINKSRLRRMKKTAFLVNTSRGEIVNESDLANAIKAQDIAGAALDVFESEPLSKTSPLLKMKNVVLAPHMGSATYQTRSSMARVAARNLLDVIEGKEPDLRFLINPEVKHVRPL